MLEVDERTRMAAGRGGAAGAAGGDVGSAYLIGPPTSSYDDSLRRAASRAALGITGLLGASGAAFVRNACFDRAQAQSHEERPFAIKSHPVAAGDDEHRGWGSDGAER